MRVILILLLVLALGCADSSYRPGSEMPAVVIKQYNFDQDRIRQGQTTGVNLVIQNLGGEKAREIKAKLFRAGEGISLPYQNVQTASTLNPPDDSTQTPGESKEFNWEIAAKTISDTKTTKSYNIGVLVGYDYKSEGFSDLLATTKEQAKIDKNQLPALRSGSTKGPATVNVITPNTILYGNEEKVTFRVDVVNGANGIVYGGRSSSDGVIGTADEMNKISAITVALPSQYVKFDNDVGYDLTDGSRKEPVDKDLWCCKPNCKGLPQTEMEDYMWVVDKSDAKEIKLLKYFTPPRADLPSLSGYKESLTLLRGKQKSYVCYFLIDKQKISEQQIIPIRAIAEYSYSTEDSKILVVEGAK